MGEEITNGHRGHRKAPAFQVGEIVGGREVTHAGDPAAYSARRRVAIRCTRCGSRWTMLECYLRWIRDGRVRVTGCLLCYGGGDDVQS